MKTDTVLYEIFRLYPNLLLELVGASSEGKSYRFEAQEVKQAHFRFDGLLLPAQPQQPIYFIECQFQKDKHFYLRLFAEIAVYLKQKRYSGDWRAVVLFARPSLDPGVPVPYQDFEQSGRLYRLYLKPRQEQPGSLRLNILQLLVVPQPQMKRRVQHVVSRIRAEVHPALEQEQILELVSTLLVYKFPNRDRRELEMTFGLRELQKTRVYLEAKEEGREEGEQIGVKRTKLEAARNLLNLGVASEVVAQALGMTLEEVNQLQH